MISLFCPSRGRPDAAKELLRSFDATRETDDVELVFCVDEDDPTREQYPPQVIVGPPTGDPTGPLNSAALSSTADIVGFIGDDSRFETHGWDRIVLNAMDEAGGGLCWADDGHEKPWPSTVFVSTKIVKALGWLALPTLKRGFFDAVWVDLAKSTGRGIPLSNVMIRHRNAENGVHPDIIRSDELAYKEWLPRLPEYARIVRSVF